MKQRLHIIYIGAILLSACSTQFIIDSKQNSIISVSATPDSLITSIINPYKTGIDSVMNEVLCVSEIEMTKGRPESLLGNFVTDLCLEQYSDLADICIMNNGGLRSTLPKGNITRGDIYKLMPFDNELVVVELDAKDFEGLLEYLVSRGGEPFSGMNIVITENEKIINHTLLRKIDFSKGETIKVLTSDYLANGGDKMSFFKDKKQTKVRVKLRDAIINYCLSKDTITSKLDGRLIHNKNEE
ncbi:MAG: 5'-nucleotidase C-terminal domain-containing protein [Flavobacteriales bacterium]